MNNSYLDKDISYLSLDDSITRLLIQNNLNFVRDIWILKRKDLKKYGLLDYQINSIIIKLQLNGLDINSKIYNCYK